MTPMPAGTASALHDAIRGHPCGAWVGTPFSPEIQMLWKCDRNTRPPRSAYALTASIAACGFSEARWLHSHENIARSYRASWSTLPHSVLAGANARFVAVLFAPLLANMWTRP